MAKKKGKKSSQNKKKQENKKVMLPSSSVPTNKKKGSSPKKIVEEKEQKEQKEQKKNATPNNGKKKAEPFTCPTCGKKIPKNSKFCLECGTFLGEKDDKEICEPARPGMPGVMPIPEKAKFQNVMKDKTFQMVEPPKKKKTAQKILFLVGALLVVILLTVALLIEAKKEEEKEEASSSTQEEKEPMNPDEEKDEIVEVVGEDVQKLFCSSKEDYGEGVTGISSVTYIYKKEELVQKIEEESVTFTDSALKFYSQYELMIEEEWNKKDIVYENTLSEMIKEKNKLGIRYATDLTADANNKKNNLSEKGTTYEKAKKNLEKQGYTCEKQ